MIHHHLLLALLLLLVLLHLPHYSQSFTTVKVSSPTTTTKLEQEEQQQLTNKSNNKSQQAQVLLASNNAEDLLQTLDLRLLLQDLALSAHTYCGQFAIRQLLDSRSFFAVSSDVSSKKYSTRIARSSVEAQEEYQKVKECMECLHLQNIPAFLNNQFLGELPYSWVFDGREGHTTSPSWIELKECNDHKYIINDNNKQQQSAFGLKDVLQVEHLLLKMKSINDWLQSFDGDNSSSSRSIRKIASNTRSHMIVINRLLELFENAVTAERSLSPATFDEFNNNTNLSTTAIKYKLNPLKFVALAKLHNREVVLRSEVQLIINRCKQDASIISKVSDDKAEFIEYDGYFVLPIQLNQASSVGKIRGYSRSGKSCYVEPHKVASKSSELKKVRSELKELEYAIVQDLFISLLEEYTVMQDMIKIMTELDVLFAKASFGLRMNGIIPRVSSDAVIHVTDFIHPIIALKNASDNKTNVPISLRLGIQEGFNSLIISGPNGGGKTVSLKSFGLVAMMCKLGIPIPIRGATNHNEDNATTIGYFDSIIPELGDKQDIVEGESTFTGRMNSCARVLDSLNPNENTLILFDELGSGSDPYGSYAISRAVLEQLSNIHNCCVVSTTHSPQLKQLSIHEKSFHSACVTLTATTCLDEGYRLPTYRLQYGSIGNSHVLEAALRCKPKLPESVLDRAAHLIANEDNTDTSFFDINKLTEEIQKEKEKAVIAREQSNEVLAATRETAVALAELTLAYENKYRRLEMKLEDMIKAIDGNPTNDYDVLGKTLSELRLVKKKALSDAEILSERGLKRASDMYTFYEGEMVVVLDGELEGETAKVTLNGSETLQKAQINIIPCFEWGATAGLPTTVMKNSIGIWDAGDTGFQTNLRRKTEIEAGKSLQQKLASLSTAVSKPKNTTFKSISSNTGSKSFTSSRQRKAAKKKNKRG